MTPRHKALAIAKAASDKKALEPLILDMRKMPSVCDYFVIASGRSTTQARAISDNIIEKLGKEGERLLHSEGEREALWILLDYGDVIVHVFTNEMRRFYELERLWGDVPQEKFKARPVKKGRAAVKKRKNVSWRRRKGNRSTR